MADTEHSAPEPFLTDVLTGLSEEQKSLPSQYFYDERGSELFDAITELPEYYLTRTEIGLLKAEAAEIADALGPNTCIVEYGAGGLHKIRLLLPHLHAPSAYVPIDVSGPFLFAAANNLAESFPSVAIEPRIGNFMELAHLPALPKVSGKTVGFFPGSTLGNLDDASIQHFFRSSRKQLGAGSVFLLGLDTNQDEASLKPAYNDAAGVTRDFNLNLLARVNRELGGTFDLGAFRHEARWNEVESRIEMHLVSLREQTVEVDGKPISFKQFESIHTENSRKFSDAQLEELVSGTGWRTAQVWRADNQRVCLYLLQAV